MPPEVRTQKVDEARLLRESERRENCLKMANNYQRKFREVHQLASTELVMWDPSEYVLIDVRTHPEKQVSIIEGAIPLESFGSKEVIQVVDDKKKVVCYCTIGYRSGMEATRLQHKYPQLSGYVYNLDGILNYTHALSEHAGAPPLVDSSTKQPTNTVHNFSNLWDFASQGYQSVSFSFPAVLGRLIQVGSLAVWRFFQRAFYLTRKGCKMA